MNFLTSKPPQLIYSIALPAAIGVGYLLATPLELTSLAVVLVLTSTLCIPIFLRWYHPLMIFCWNATVTVFFLPGRPSLWMVMAVLGLGLAILNWIMDRQTWRQQVPAVSFTLILFALIVVITAKVAGGLGLYSFGSENYGGKGYFYILGAVAGYFALSSRAIPAAQAPLWVGVYFLAGLTAAVGDVLAHLGPSTYFLRLFFPGGQFNGQTAAETSGAAGMLRLGGVSAACVVSYCFMLSRFGIRGIFDLGKPWRLLLFLLIIAASLLGGFRSVLAIMLMVFAVQFFFEGLLRTFLFPLFLIGGIIALLLLIPLADKLPASIQRTLSILPVAVDPAIRIQAENSARWRLEMWNDLLPDLHKYLIMGKGYSIDPTEMYLTDESVKRGLLPEYANSMLAGDYHSGPLSLYVPFGSVGVIGFALFLFASTRVLYRNYRYGDPALARINTFLLSLFVARIIAFVFIFGAISSELYCFTGLIGLSVALNGGGKNVPGPEPVRM